MPMEGLKKRLSFRKKKKDQVPECSQPHQWQEDEKKVHDGTCSFQVRYMGCIEVFDGRGIQVCEEAVKTLKAKCKGKYQQAILYVSGDALRVVDEISKSMIVDQTIEKVSFCAPDRNNVKGFSYISRDGTTRRWLCHGFLAVKESGERLSHAVACAFAACLKKKQKRDKESTASVTVSYSQDRTSFERMGSFRQTTLTERLTDPQSAILAEPVPVKVIDNPFAVQRPHATQNLLVRQGSFRGFSKLQEASSPFKRTLSLRLNDLPSTLARQNFTDNSPMTAGVNNNGVIHEMPSPEQEESIAQMCQQLTHGLTALSDDKFVTAPLQGSHSAALVKQHSIPATFHAQPVSMHHPAQPVHETNPWASTTSPKHSISALTKPGPFQVHTTPPINPFLSSSTSASSSSGRQTDKGKLLQENRSHSMDTSLGSGWQAQSVKKHTLMEMALTQNFQVNGGAISSGLEPKAAEWATPAMGTVPPAQSHSRNIDLKDDAFDPFDVAWAAKSSLLNKHSVPQTSNASNHFTAKTVTSYKLDL